MVLPKGETRYDVLHYFSCALRVERGYLQKKKQTCPCSCRGPHVYMYDQNTINEYNFPIPFSTFVYELFCIFFINVNFYLECNKWERNGIELNVVQVRKKFPSSESKFSCWLYDIYFLYKWRINCVKAPSIYTLHVRYYSLHTNISGINDFGYFAAHNTFWFCIASSKSFKSLKNK